MTGGLDVFSSCLRKGDPCLFWGGIGYGRRRMDRVVREAEGDRTLEHRLAGLEDPRTEPHWQLGCCLVLLLRRLRAWDHR